MTHFILGNDEEKYPIVGMQDQFGNDTDLPSEAEFIDIQLKQDVVQTFEVYGRRIHTLQ